jgi:CRP/FNR family transcriptional regulator, anaerobic regulatory protein
MDVRQRKKYSGALIYEQRKINHTANKKVINNTELGKLLNRFGQELISKILEGSVIEKFPKNTEIIKEGQYIKVVPIVLKGLVKVFTGEEHKELLLYYIQPGESCIMSFSACLKNEKSKIFAITQDETTAILIPCDKLSRWIFEYPNINQLFYQQFDLRYTELMDTIHHLLFDKLDKRLLDYLKEKVSLTDKNPVKITHKEIANDLGTAREVISRLIKKLEHLEKVKQHHDSIELL